MHVQHQNTYTAKSRKTTLGFINEWFNGKLLGVIHFGFATIMIYFAYIIYTDRQCEKKHNNHHCESNGSGEPRLFVCFVLNVLNLSGDTIPPIIGMALCI
eukprot:399268_1